MDKIKKLERVLNDNNNKKNDENDLIAQLDFCIKKNNDNVKKIENLENQLEQSKNRLNNSLRNNNNYKNEISELKESKQKLENILKNYTILFIQELKKMKSENDKLKDAYLELENNQRNVPNLNIIIRRQRPMSIFEQMDNYFNQIERNMEMRRQEMERGLFFGNSFFND
jgi:chromosome segregation ATPase